MSEDPSIERCWRCRHPLVDVPAHPWCAKTCPRCFAKNTSPQPGQQQEVPLTQTPEFERLMTRGG